MHLGSKMMARIMWEESFAVPSFHNLRHVAYCEDSQTYQALDRNVVIQEMQIKTPDTGSQMVDAPVLPLFYDGVDFRTFLVSPYFLI